MWPFFWLNLGLAVVTIGVMVWAVRRIERRSEVAIEHLTASLRNELLASIRAELARPAPPGTPPPADEWTSEKNARRVALVKRAVRKEITPEESVELAALQDEVDRYLARVAPRPLAALRELHQQLLAKAASSGKV